ncbi:Zinc finger C3H1 domain-containing protein, partial [Blyttiomyces sp. JEL0837]
MANQPQLFLEVKKLILVLLEAGFTLQVLSLSGLAPEILLACADGDLSTLVGKDVGVRRNDVDSSRPSKSTRVPPSIEPPPPPALAKVNATSSHGKPNRALSQKDDDVTAGNSSRKDAELERQLQQQREFLLASRRSNAKTKSTSGVANTASEGSSAGGETGNSTTAASGSSAMSPPAATAPRIEKVESLAEDDPTPATTPVPRPSLPIDVSGLEAKRAAMVNVSSEANIESIPSTDPSTFTSSNPVPNNDRIAFSKPIGGRPTRPSAADLNVNSWNANGHVRGMGMYGKKFIPDGPDKLIIELSDSESDDVGTHHGRRGNINAGTAGGGSGSGKQTGTPILAASTLSTSNGAANANPNGVEIAKIKDMEDEIRKLSEKIALKEKAKRSKGKNGKSANGNLGSNASLNADVGDKEKETKVAENSVVEVTATASSESLASIPPSQPKPPVERSGSHSPPKSKPQATAAVTSTSSGTKPAVVVGGAISGNTKTLIADTIKQIQTEIETDEALLASALKDITKKEETVKELQQQCQEVDTQIEASNSQVSNLTSAIAELQSKLDEEKSKLDGLVQRKDEVSGQVSSLKKVILSKGYLATELRAGLNLKRQRMITTPAQNRAANNASGLKRGSVAETGASKKAKISGGEKPLVKSLQPTVETVPVPAPLPPPQQPGDFIQFKDVEEEVANAMAAQGAIAAASETLPTPALALALKPSEATRKARFDEIVWTEPETAETFVSLGMVIFRPEDLCLLRDVYDAVGVDNCNGHWNEARASVTNTKANTSNDYSESFEPYSSPLEGLRATRLSKSFANGRVPPTSLTYTSKIDCNRKMCLFEVYGGTCNDATCTSQHFRDIVMTDNEVFLDLTKYLDDDGSEIGKQMRSIAYSAKAKGKSVSEIAELLSHYRTSVVGKLRHGNRPFEANWDDRSSRTESGGKEAASVQVFKEPNETRGRAVEVFEVDYSTLIHANQPVLIEGLRKLLHGEEVKQGRYYLQSFSEEEYEEIVAKEPNNVQIWVNFATHVLPPSFSFETLEQRQSPNLNKSLNILSRALEFNKESAILWNMYLELYVRRGKEDQIVGMFEHSLGWVKDTRSILWRYFVWKGGPEHKEILLKRMLTVFVEMSKDDPKSQSYMILCAAVQVVRLYLACSFHSIGLTWLINFLTSKDFGWMFEESSQHTDYLAILHEVSDLSGSACATFMTAEDYATIWIIFLHIVYHGTLPEHLLKSFPHDYLVDNSLFAILWNGKSGDEELVPSGLLANTSFADCIGDVVRLWRNWDVGIESHAYWAIINTYANFAKSGCGGARVKVLQDLKDELDALSFKNLAAVGAKRIPFLNSPFTAFWFNQTVKIAVKRGNFDEALVALVNSVYVYYENLELISDASLIDFPMVHDLFAKALGLQASLDSTYPLKAQLSRASLRSDVFIWLNFILFATLNVKAEQLDVISPSSSKSLDTPPVMSIREIFTHAMDYITGPQQRQILWSEFIEFENPRLSDRKMDKAILIEQSRRSVAVLAKALSDTPVLEKHPLDEQSDQAIDFMKLVPIRNCRVQRSWLRTIYDSLPGEKPDDKKLELLESLDQDSEIVAACPWIAKRLFEAKHVKKGKMVISTALASNPKSEFLWRLALSVESLGGQFGSDSAATKLYELAQNFLSPTASVFQEFSRFAPPVDMDME